MLTQVYAIKSIDEMRMCIEAGLDRWGLEVGEKGIMPSEMNYEATREVFAATPSDYPRMALTIETDIETIVELVIETRPDLLHLCGELDRFSPGTVAQLRERIPDVGIIQAIPVGGPESVAAALAYDDVSDVLFLDSNDPAVSGIGIAGVTHDWNVSRSIVETVTSPCILAGGLSPENVADAVRTVQPWGVDSNTHTCIPGTWVKDFERMRRFNRMAKSALPA